jgi:Arc/MetJ-type ribon-helix-helix transcriptional regulator
MPSPGDHLAQRRSEGLLTLNRAIAPRRPAGIPLRALGQVRQCPPDVLNGVPADECGRAGRPGGSGPGWQARRRIPFWHHIGMSTQIAVRLPDDMVKFVDQLVERGRGSSRAAVISRALDRERRHEMAVQDAAIYAEAGEDADMTDLVRHLSGQPVDPDQ